MLTGAREAALKALGIFRRSGTFPQDALDAAAKKYRLEPRDTALSQKICRGVLRNMAFLDWHIARVSGRPCEKMEPQVLDILRMGAYQILFLDKVPVSAAVNESVELTKKYANPKASGLVNALLRRLAREKEALPEILFPTAAQTLSVRYSHPLWLVEEYLARLGEAETRQLLEADNQEPPVTLQTNFLKTTPEKVLEELASLEPTVHPWLPGAFLVSGQGKLSELPALREGRIWVQDAAARTSVKAAGLKSGMNVLDVCAAPGGKSFAAAVEMENKGDLRSFDIAAGKIDKIESGAERLGIFILRAAPMNAAGFVPTLENWADAVIADVPCSGFGTLRKNPDVRYKKQEDVQGLIGIQRDILDNVSRYVRPGGVLLYSTCTLRMAENEENVMAFLEKHPEFSLEPFAVPGAKAPEGMFTFWPQKQGTDGFFAAKLRRKQSDA